MDAGGGLWSILTIIGPIALALVLLWAVLRNRKRSQAERDLTERRTREIYDEGRTEETTHHGKV